MQTPTAAQTYFLYAATKRGTWHVWASQLEFSPLASVCLRCVNTKPLSTFAEHHGFRSAYLSFTTFFLFAGRMPVYASPQPHDAKTNTQHNDCFMLHFTPRFFFFFCLIFQLPLCHVSVCLLHQPPSVHLSRLTPSCRSLVLNCQLFPELSAQPQLPFFFFFTFLSLPLLLHHSSPTQGHITKLCCHTAFPVWNLFHLCLWTTPTSWQFHSKGHRDALLPKTFLCSHIWMLSGNNFAVAECCLMILVCVILVVDFRGIYMSLNGGQS